MPNSVVDLEFDHKLAHTEQMSAYYIYAQRLIINTIILNPLHHFCLLHEIQLSEKFIRRGRRCYVISLEGST